MLLLYCFKLSLGEFTPVILNHELGGGVSKFGDVFNMSSLFKRGGVDDATGEPIVHLAILGLAQLK